MKNEKAPWMGLRLHLIIINREEFLRFYFSNLNIDDRGTKAPGKMNPESVWKLFTDRGRILQKLAEYLWSDGVVFILKRQRNIKKIALTDTDNILLQNVSNPVTLQVSTYISSKGQLAEKKPLIPSLGQLVEYGTINLELIRE